MVEIDGEDEADDGGDIGKDNNGGKALGYALPDSSDLVNLNLNELCVFADSGAVGGLKVPQRHGQPIHQYLQAIIKPKRKAVVIMTMVQHHWARLQQ